MKYHLFCGDTILPDYINVDKYNKKADKLCDVMDLKGKNIEEIYMSHGLEHLDLNTAERFLGKAYRMLAEGGKLIMTHPDTLATARSLVAGSIPMRKFEMLIWGYQSNRGEYHFSGYTPRSIRDKLRKAGFKDIRISHKRKPYEMRVEATK